MLIMIINGRMKNKETVSIFISAKPPRESCRIPKIQETGGLREAGLPAILPGTGLLRHLHQVRYLVGANPVL